MTSKIGRTLPASLHYSKVAEAKFDEARGGAGLSMTAHPSTAKPFFKISNLLKHVPARLEYWFR